VSPVCCFVRVHNSFASLHSCLQGTILIAGQLNAPAGGSVINYGTATSRVSPRFTAHSVDLTHSGTINCTLLGTTAYIRAYLSNEASAYVVVQAFAALYVAKHGADFKAGSTTIVRPNGNLYVYNDPGDVALSFNLNAGANIQLSGH